MMPLEQKFLEDGSFTLFEPEVGEHYHNRVGAYTESLEQYTRLALQHWQDNHAPLPTELQVWDVCFGLGYNTFTLIHQLALEQATLQTPCVTHIHINAVELDEQLIPLWPLVLHLPVYPLFQPGKGYAIHHTPTSIEFIPEAGSPFPHATIHLTLGDALVALPEWEACLTAPVHAVFHDAFSPRKVPHLWQASIFQTYANVLCRERGVILTYSVARLVKDALEQDGLVWQKTEALHSLGHKKGGLMGFHP